jgi:hypothetical protein
VFDPGPGDCCRRLQGLCRCESANSFRQAYRHIRHVHTSANFEFDLLYARISAKSVLDAAPAADVGVRVWFYL